MERNAVRWAQQIYYAHDYNVINERTVSDRFEKVRCNRDSLENKETMVNSR